MSQFYPGFLFVVVFVVVVFCVRKEKVFCIYYCVSG